MKNMPSPVLDAFKDTKYVLLGMLIMIAYGGMLLLFDQFLFFSPYLTLYVPASEYDNILLDLTLTILTSIVLTVSIRQISLQRQGGNASKTGIFGIVAAVLAGACPCYYLPALLAVAGTIGGAVGAVGILLNAFQIPIKLGALAILAVATYNLNKSGICKIPPPRSVVRKQDLKAHEPRGD